MKMIFCSQYHAFHAYYTNRDLSNKLESAAVESPESMAMIHYQPEVIDINTILQELRKDQQALVAQVTALKQDNHSLHSRVRFLETTAKKQAALTKTLESKVNPAEPTPPEYGLSPPSKPTKKTHW